MVGAEASLVVEVALSKVSLYYKVMEYFKFHLDKCWEYPCTKQGLDEAIADGCYPIVKQFIDNVPNLIDEPVHRYSQYTMFVNACCRGHLDIVQWMVRKFPTLLILNLVEHAFSETCASGKIHVARWLYAIVPGIDISHDDNYAFVSALFNKHYHVCRWLYTLNMSAIDINYYFGFILL